MSVLDEASRNRRPVVLLVLAGLAVLTASSYSVGWMSWFRVSLGLLLLAVVLSAAVIAVSRREGVEVSESPRIGRGAWAVLAGLIVVHCVTAVLLERALPGDDIDCYTFQKTSVQRLLHGVDPYGQTEANVFSAKDTELFFGPGMVRDGRVQVGFQYPPVTLLWALPGYLLGDVRYSYVLAVVLAAVVCFVTWPGRVGLVMAGFLLVNPIAFNVENRAWTEPLVFLALCWMMYAAVQRRWWLPVAVGLFLATKQYNFLALPFLGLLVQPFAWGRYLRMMGVAILVALATAVPFAVWNFGALWHDMVLFHLAQPFRADALSFAVPYPVMTKVGPLLAVAMVAWVAGCVWGRGKSSVALFAAAYGSALLVFVATSKQAFCNYYYLIGQTLLLAAAGMVAMRPARVASPVPATMEEGVRVC
jgi:hypothetical protein